MKVVVDSNIAFSAILNTKSSIGDIIMNSQDTFAFFACEFLKEEIDEHKNKLLRLTGYSEQELDEVITLIYHQINFYAESTIPLKYWQKAADFVRDTDMNDIAHVAISLFLEAKLWTGDKALINGLNNKGFKNIITIQDMLSIRNAI